VGCPSCGAENPATNRFCGGCGAALVAVCSVCGERNPTTSRFCGACGARLGEGAAAAPAPAPTPAPAIASPDSYTPRHLAEKILTARSTLAGERKQVTVLFADVKGSTELIEALDTEQAQILLDGAVRVMMEAVHRYEGTVSRLMGDGLMALFGAPIAHEDHAIRACFAALALQDGMRRFAAEVFARHGLRVEARAGLNSGEVVVRLISDDLHMDYTAMGQTVHLASRMESLAREGTALLTPETVALAEGYVQVRSLGRAPVKGLAQPVEVFELVGVGAARTRLQVSALRGLTRFVGRESELEAIYQSFERAGRGQGQVVALVGEPGVGKSRLVWEATHSHRTAGWLVLESGSVSYGKATSYLPVIDLLKAYCRIEARDDYRVIREKLTGKLLTLDRALEPILVPLLALLDVPVVADGEDGVGEGTVVPDAWASLDPSQRRRWTLDAMKRLLLRESQVQPLLLVFEDLHWIDEATQALLDSLVESLPRSRILLLVNYRPEYTHGWGGKACYTQLRIDPLSAAGADELLVSVLGADPSVQALKPLLIERTEGNPFFLEESVRTLFETGALVGEPGAYRLARPLAGVRVPATVQAILAARIDRLPPDEKRLLQTASVIGKDVPFALLREIAGLPESDLYGILAHLQTADLLYEANLFPELEYTFKHALTHEVVYGSLLQERRRSIHAELTRAIPRVYPERLTEYVELLAHHAFRGELWASAVEYLLQAYAGDMAHSANRQAATYAEQALVAIDHLADGPEKTAQAIDVRIQLRHALWAIGEFRRIREILAEAEVLAAASGDRRRRGWVLLYSGSSSYGAADHDASIVAVGEALALAEAVEDETLTILSLVNLGQALGARTDFEASVEVLARAIGRLAGDLRHERFGQATIPAVLARVNLVRSLCELGRFSEATPLAEEAVWIAEQADHASSLAIACWIAGKPYLLRGAFAEAIPLLERGIAICQERGLPTYPHWGAPALGAAYALAGRAPEAVTVLEQRLQLDEAMGLLSQHTLTTVYLAEALFQSGREVEALARVTSALDLARARNERGYEAWALRLLGEILAQQGASHAEAERAYLDALALAEDLGMRPLVAHANRGLGTLYGCIGSAEQSQAYLTKATDLYRSLDMPYWLTQTEGRLATTG
jgi:class 3 adenylate cyclase/tetratricopeptide (TPR) repeat protein